MSRPLIILVVVLLAIVVAAVALASLDTEVAPTVVRKPVLAGAQPK